MKYKLFKHIIDDAKYKDTMIGLTLMVNSISTKNTQYIYIKDRRRGINTIVADIFSITKIIDIEKIVMK